MAHIDLTAPIEETIVRTYSSFTFSIAEVIPNDSIRVNLVVYADDNTAKNFAIVISGDEYKGWNSDDDYLIDLLRDKITGLLQ
jgi:hypothetical protein